MIPPPDEVYCRLLREILPERIMNEAYRRHLADYLEELITARYELCDGQVKLQGLLQALIEDWDHRQAQAKPDTR